MAKQAQENRPLQIKRWAGGLADYLKENAVPDSFYFARSINYRNDPQSVTLLPGSKNESGSVVTDLLKWGEIVPDTNANSYFYGDTGNLYKRSSQGQWSLLHNSANSHGNGLGYFTGDGYLYYANDSTLGRYGQITDVFSFSEDWSSNTINPNNWFNWSTGQASVSSSLLSLTSTLAAGFYGVELVNAQNMTGYSVTNQLVDVGSRSISTYEVYPIYITKRGDSTYQLFWFIDASNVLRAYKKLAGVNTSLANTTYDPAIHKYFRIREASGTSYFDYSTDSTNWTNFTSVSNPFALTSTTIGQQIGTSATSVAITSAVFDNFTFGPTVNSAQFVDNFLGSQGGAPLNTASLSLVAASSQYATAADSASLSITGDLTLEAFFKASSLPAVGSSMTLIGKWDENANTRSYKMDIYGISGYFGDGGSSSLTISGNTTQAPIDSTASAAAASNFIIATNASFAAGQVILIHQTQGTNAGQWERNTIQSYTTGQITTGTPLLGSYGTGAQVIVIPQYTTITVNAGVTWLAKAWNGSVGGILVGLAQTGITNNGTISATGRGFRGGTNLGDSADGRQGEGTVSAGGVSIAANGNGGGGGQQGAGGGGGGNGTAGLRPSVPANINVGNGGAVAGSADLTTLELGGGGGSSADGTGGGNGGTGGGIIFLSGTAITNVSAGVFVSNGNTGSAGSPSNFAGGGAGGSGGSILLKTQVGTLLTGTTASGGAGGTAGGGGASAGGAGGDGRIAVYYLTSTTGSATPTINTIQDNSLVTTVSYQARLGISNDGTAAEYLTKNFPTLNILTWNRLSIAWKASTSTATFVLNGASFGTSIGTMTSIANTVALTYIGADKGASAVGNFFDGKVDDVRIWANTQTVDQIAANNVAQLSGGEGGLAAYWKLNSAATDSTANANNLTLVNTPTYSTDVPFPASTTRLDIDQSRTTGGSTYALPTAISEVTADSLTFTPGSDPQASVDFKVTTKGSGDWTVIVHDSQNRLVATQTILNARIPAAGSYIEFVFDTPWRIVIGKTYHMHLISTVADGAVESSSSNNINTGTFHTYFGFLVTDTQFHPIMPFLQFMVVGNERYLATWDGAFYQPNLIAFPTGTKVRCFGLWREFLAIGTWRGNTITGFDQGRIYFWDGSAPTFNFFIDVPQGQINALYGKDSDLYLFAGYRGVLMKYTGGGFYANGNSAAVKLKRIPKIATSDYVEVYPGALTIWRDLVHFGMSANSDSTTVEKAVYSWGSLNQMYPETLSCDYPISTGNRGSTVSLGLTFPVGQSLIVGWRDGVATGADVVNFSNPPAAEGLIETLVMDDQALWKDKLNFDIRADHLALQSGESVQVGISIDRGGFTTGGKVSTDGTFTKLPFASGRGREYQLSVYLYATGTTSPTLLSLGVLHDDTASEAQW